MARPGYPPLAYSRRTNGGEFHPTGLRLLVEEFELPNIIHLHRSFLQEDARLSKPKPPQSVPRVRPSLEDFGQNIDAQHSQ